MNLRGDDEVSIEHLNLGAVSSVKMGTKSQRMLTRSGDDLRIEGGYFYLSTKGQTSTYTREYALEDGSTANESFVCARADVKSEGALFTFAYDDIKCIEYFHDHLTSYWNKDGATILSEIEKAMLKDIYTSYDTMTDSVYHVAKKLQIDQEVIWTLINEVSYRVVRNRGLI